MQETVDGRTETAYYRREAQRHWGWWSLLPALVAVMLCWLTKEPVTALLGGIVAGALILGGYDITGDVLIPSVATTKSAGIVVLYLWLLGGADGSVVANRRRAGVRRVHDRPLRARPAHRQAGGVVARRDLLPRRHGEHGAGGHDGEADCGQRAREPRGACLCGRFHGVAHRFADRLQRLARLRAGVHLRRRSGLSGHRGGPRGVLLLQRAVLLLRHLRGGRHVPAERREAALSRQADGGGDAPFPRNRAAGRPRCGPLEAPRTCKAATCRRAIARTCWSSSCRWAR